MSSLSKFSKQNCSPVVGVLLLTASAIITAELALPSTTTLVNEATINYWLKIIFCTTLDFLTLACGEMKSNSPWHNFLLRLVANLGFWGALDSVQPFVKQRLLHQSAQTNVGLVGTSRTLILYRQRSPTPLTLPPYFTDLRNCKPWMAFTKAHCL